MVADLVAAWRKKGVIERYRWWGAVATLSGVMNRHSFVRLNERTSLCVWICLVAFPSNGKSTIIKRVNWIWNEVGTLQMLSNNFTRANFVDRMEGAQEHWRKIHGPKAYSSCMVWAQDELGDQMAAYDSELTTFLTKSWGDDLELSEGRRGHKDGDKVIFRPGLSLIVGNQPAKMATTFPATSWGQGFTDRMLFVYNPENTKRNPFTPSVDGVEMGLSDKDIFGEFIKVLRLLSKSYYDISLSQEVIDYATAWYGKDYAPVPQHPKLEYYNSRRTFHATKLAGIFTVARVCRDLSKIAKGVKLEMNLDDFKCGLSMLLENETFLPGMFGASMDTTNEAVYIELEAFIKNKSGSALVTEIKQWLRKTVATHNVENVFKVAVNSGMFKVVGAEGPSQFVKLLDKTAKPPKRSSIFD